MKRSNSSTDCGSNGARAFAASGVITAAVVGGRDAAGAGAGARVSPFAFGCSTVAEAMSSSREVAASSLWMTVVSLGAEMGMVGIVANDTIRPDQCGIEAPENAE